MLARHPAPWRGRRETSSAAPRLDIGCRDACTSRRQARNDSRAPSAVIRAGRTLTINSTVVALLLPTTLLSPGAPMPRRERIATLVDALIGAPDAVSGDARE